MAVGDGLRYGSGGVCPPDDLASNVRGAENEPTPHRADFHGDVERLDRVR